MIPPPVGMGRDTRRRALARSRLERVLRNEDGTRRLPREAELVEALEACDPRDAWWTCETSSHGPLYLLPTREWLRTLIREIRKLGARRVLEVAAGDGFLAACLARSARDLEVTAVDDASWERPAARMSARDRREMRGVPIAGLVPGTDVLRLDAVKAVHRFRPDLVLVSWAPPGDLVQRLVTAKVPRVIEIGTEGDECGAGPAGWADATAFLDGAVERRALCRLDARPSAHRATRVTLYEGAPENGSGGIPSAVRRLKCLPTPFRP